MAYETVDYLVILALVVLAVIIIAFVALTLSGRGFGTTLELFTFAK